MVISRTLAPFIQETFHKYPIVSLHGPRQSGKTTLIQSLFPNVTYVNLENLDVQDFAKSDPHGFLDTYAQNTLIIDEVQRVPSLFSYIQTRSDEKKTPGQFILTGSQNLLLHEGISQSLAGRVALFTLLPFTRTELSNYDKKPETLEEQLLTGLYPRIYEMELEPTRWYSNYIDTYIEKDVRSLKQITDLHLFHKFIRLCAGRTGQVLNLSSLADDCGISHNTVRSWISVLEASYIIFLLEPYYKNYNKRIIKSPKLYFYDTGLAATLLGLETPEQVQTYYNAGSLFETYVVSELVKMQYHQDTRPRTWYWQDKGGREIDLILEHGDRTSAVEIKRGKTIQPDSFKNLLSWQKLSQTPATNSYVVYGGDESQKRTQASVVGWKNIETMLQGE